jgi:hypothetical protein
MAAVEQGSAFAFVLASLAVWRVTHLVNAEDGPWDLAARLRARIGRLRSPMPARLVGCFYCLSVWVALPFVPWLTREPAPFIVSWLALSAAAIVIERLSARTPPAQWHEGENA